MSIRLSKAVKDLNVGLTTAVEFLEKKGQSVDANPNTKITDEQYDMLVSEFSKDKTLKIESEKISQQRQEKEKNAPSVELEGFGEKKKGADANPKKGIVKVENVHLEIEKDMMPKVKTVGKIDLDSLKKKEEPAKPKKVEKETKLVVKTVQVKKKPEVVVPKKEDVPVEAPQLKEEKKENIPVVKSGPEIFSLGIPKLKNAPNVVGKIDLSAINDKTRPDKKSKEEKRKEREERDKKLHPEKKKRARITTERVEFSHTNDNNNNRNGANKKIPNANTGQRNNNRNNASSGAGNNASRKIRGKRGNQKAVITENDVQKQVKETLARLTEKKVKGAKYRREKRENFANRQEEEDAQERKDGRILKLTEFVTANELAVMMNVSVNQVIATCMNLGIMVSINQRLDAETINIVADEFGFKTEFVSAEVVQAIQSDEDEEDESKLVHRAPIVTVMGHVDHGKTSLLDYIRKANVIAGEAGGITQHIGAYNVKLSNGQRITFLDTPGHEAFTAMRARGAKVTDIAIIIVAADDSVMPQTIEAINHATAANVPIVFAINKIDKDGANPDKIKEELANMNYLVEEWGGKYQSQDISAKKGLNVKELLEKVLLEAELLDLKANPNRKAVGSIIESSLDKGRGYVSTVLIETGTLHVGDVVLAGPYYGRVKAMFNERNQRIKQAGPSEPALILGLNGAPQAGDNINVMSDEHEAREIANKREQLQREQGIRTSTHLTLDEIGRRIALGNFQELNIIVKGDVDGSIEALSDSLLKLSTPEIQVNVIHKAVGGISESDVMLAAASNAIIIGFQVRPSVLARRLAEREGIDIRLYSIIYDAIEEIKDAMEGMLSPDLKEEIMGTVEVREIFKISKVGTIAGCMVTDGKVKRTSKIRVIRDGIVVFTGELASLKIVKDDAKEVSHGFECGLNIAGYNDIKVGDLIEAYEMKEVKRTL